MRPAAERRADGRQQRPLLRGRVGAPAVRAASSISYAAVAAAATSAETAATAAAGAANATTAAAIAASPATAPARRGRRLHSVAQPRRLAAVEREHVHDGVAAGDEHAVARAPREAEQRARAAAARRRRELQQRALVGPRADGAVDAGRKEQARRGRERERRHHAAVRELRAQQRAGLDVPCLHGGLPGEDAVASRLRECWLAV